MKEIFVPFNENRIKARVENRVIILSVLSGTLRRFVPKYTSSCSNSIARLAWLAKTYAVQITQGA